MSRISNQNGEMTKDLTDEQIKKLRSKLIICPFCKQSPDIEPKTPSRQGNSWGQVYCRTTKCPANPVVLDGIHVADERGTIKYIEAAIKRWNRCGA